MFYLYVDFGIAIEMMQMVARETVYNELKKSLDMLLSKKDKEEVTLVSKSKLVSEYAKNTGCSYMYRSEYDRLNDYPMDAILIMQKQTVTTEMLNLYEESRRNDIPIRTYNVLSRTYSTVPYDFSRYIDYLCNHGENPVMALSKADREFFKGQETHIEWDKENICVSCVDNFGDREVVYQDVTPSVFHTMEKEKEMEQFELELNW